MFLSCKDESWLIVYIKYREIKMWESDNGLNSNFKNYSVDILNQISYVLGPCFSRLI